MGSYKITQSCKGRTERVYAVNPAKNKPKQQAAAAPKKSIRERAAMQARVDENNVKPEDQK